MRIAGAAGSRLTGLTYNSKAGTHLLEVEAAHAAQALHRHQREVHRHPVAPLADVKDALFIANDKLGDGRRGIDVDGERDADLARWCPIGIVGAAELAADHVVHDVDRDHTAGDRPLAEPLRRRREEREGPIGPEDVRRSHAAQLARGGSRRGKVCRHSDDGRADAVLLEHVPERLAVAQQRDVRARERQLQLPIVSDRVAASVFVVDKYGTIVAGSRWMKSKMPCPSGGSPVMKLDHATGLCAGIEVASGAKLPAAATFAKFGIRPCAMRSRVTR